MSSPVHAVPLASGAGDLAITDRPGVLMGFSIRESAAVAAVATVIIRDGIDNTGKILAVVELAADKSETKWFGPTGKRVNTGIWVDRVIGETEGAIDVK